MGAMQVGYFGSKATSGLCQPLIAMMPPHATYIETHLGGGALMRRKAPALRNIGIDRAPLSARCVRVRLPRRAHSRVRPSILG